MVQGRSKQAFKTWLADRDQSFRDSVEVVAMDGFTGFKTATTEELPDAVAVMDPFHAVRLAGDAMYDCRRRVQQAIYGQRGHTGDPLYTARRTLHTGADLHTDKQRERIRALFAADEHVELEATWGIYQRMIAAYPRTRPREGPRTDEQRDRVRRQRRARSIERGPPARPHTHAPSRRRACLLRSAGDEQRPDRGDQRTPGTPARVSARDSGT